MNEPTYYAILGVPTAASQQEIKRAYRCLAQQYHPDVHPGNCDAEARFKLIAAAAEVLSDPHRRASYDADLATRPDFAARIDTKARRDGYDVEYDLTLSPVEAAEGTRRALDFHASDGSPYQVIVLVPAGSRAGTRLRLIGQGGPALYGPGRGDFYVTIRIAKERGT